VTDPIKVYDARWEVAQFDDSEVARLFEATLIYARLLDVDTITVTRDARLGCARVMEIGLEVALRLGFRVLLCADPISTPLAYFTTLKATLRHPNTMGLAITASHNPGSYVGIKFTVPPVRAIGLDCGPLGGLTRVREIYHSDQRATPVKGGELQVIDHPAEEYITFCLAQAGVEKGELEGLTVVLDAFNGSAGPEMHAALRRAGAQVRHRRLVPDGRFPTGSPNPTSRGKMDAALDLARACQADCVVGVDGDGDRLVIGDSRGILSAGFVAIPVIGELLERRPPAGTPVVLYDPKVNPLALLHWGGLNVLPVLFRNGHSQIKDYMHTRDALFAAEESGHYYHRLALGDRAMAAEASIITLMLFLSATKRRPGAMDELWERQGEVFSTGEFNYQFASDQARDEAIGAIVDRARVDGAEIRTATSEGIDLQGTVVYRGVSMRDDGVALENQWYSGYFRVATTERAVVRSYLSTADRAYAEELEGGVRELLGNQLGGVVVD